MTDYLILALATWRISSLLANEAGPYDAFERLRKRAGTYYDDYSNAQGKNELAKMLICTWCNSVWVGTLWLILYLAFNDYAVYLACPFAASTFVIAVDNYLRGNG